MEIVKSMPAVQAKNALSSSRMNAALKAKLLEEISERSKAR
jgi:predicted house-cleaning noncanonical NTP pyrophosphatase (MazG superfamily)